MFNNLNNRKLYTIYVFACLYTRYVVKGTYILLYCVYWKTFFFIVKSYDYFTLNTKLTAINYYNVNCNNTIKIVLIINYTHNVYVVYK